MNNVTKISAERIGNKSIPSFYFNGFSIAGSEKDVVFIANKNGNDEVIFNVSYETAQSLFRGLLETAMPHEVAQSLLEEFLQKKEKNSNQN